MITRLTEYVIDLTSGFKCGQAQRLWIITASQTFFKRIFVSFVSRDLLSMLLTWKFAIAVNIIHNLLLIVIPLHWNFVITIVIPYSKENKDASSDIVLSVLVTRKFELRFNVHVKTVIPGLVRQLYFQNGKLFIGKTPYWYWDGSLLVWNRESRQL